MSYSWKILNLSTKDETNADGVVLESAVVKVRWQKTLTTDEGIKVSTMGNDTFSAENIAESDFIAFDDLVETDVIAWIEASHSEKRTQVINDSLARKVAARDVTPRSVPW